MKTRTLCLLATLALALAAPSASAFRYDGTGPPPAVPCPNPEPGSGGGALDLVLDAADSTAETTCTALAGYEEDVRAAYADAEKIAKDTINFLGPFIDLPQDLACLVVFGSPDGSDDLPPYSRDLCKEIVVGTTMSSEMDLCYYLPCGWQA